MDPARAKTEAEAAYADGGLTTSPDDDAYAQKSLRDVNRLSSMSNYNEFRMSASMESVLKGYADPRMAEYFLPAVNTGTYEGLRNGLTIDQLGLGINKVNANSHVGHRWADPAVFPGVGDLNFLATPQIVMCTAEAYFLRAESVLFGWHMGGSAKELYEEGITNSMIQWGITNSTVITN